MVCCFFLCFVKRRFNVKESETEIDVPGIIIGAIFIGFFTQKVLLPFFVQLKDSFISIFLDWKLDLIFLIIDLYILKLVFYLRKKKRERLERERIEDARFWKEHNEAEERRKQREAYLLPKPKVLPLFVGEIKEESMWKDDEEEELDGDYYETLEDDEEPKRRKSINVDLQKHFYKRKELNEDEIEYLIKQGYQEFSYKSICTKKKENYILKQRFNESLNHMIVIFDLAEYLDRTGVEYEMFMTRMPDIVMSFGRKKIALEVETGTVMTNMSKFREKLNLLKKNYKDDWYFIVTNRNKITKYKKYGKVIDPRYIKGQVDKIIANARK